MRKLVAETSMKRITKDLSSYTIVDLDEVGAMNPIYRIKNRFKNSIVFDQTEGVFTDFSRKSFSETAINIYERVHDAYIKQNKATLLNLLSYPLQEAISHSNRGGDNLKLPFTFHDRISGAKLRQGNCI